MFEDRNPKQDLFNNFPKYIYYNTYMEKKLPVLYFLPTGFGNYPDTFRLYS